MAGRYWRAYPPPDTAAPPLVVQTDVVLEFTVTEDNYEFQRALFVAAAVGAQYYIDWNVQIGADGIIPEFTGQGEIFTSTSTTSQAHSHTYATAGVYYVRVVAYAGNSVTEVKTAVGTTGNTRPSDYLLTGIMKYVAPNVTNLSYAFSNQEGMVKFGSQVEWQTGSVTNCSYMAYNWTQFNDTLPDTFLTHQGSSSNGTAAYAFYNWNSFNQVLPENFMRCVAFRTISYAFYHWSVYNQPLPTGFLSGNYYTVCSFAMTGWWEFDQPLPAENFFGPTQTARITNAQSLFSGWRTFNQPLPAGFFTSYPLCISFASTFLEWRMFNSALNAGFMCDTSGTHNVRGFGLTFKGWLVFNQPLPEGFMPLTSKITDMTETFALWYEFDQELPVGFIQGQANYQCQFQQMMEYWEAYSGGMPLLDVTVPTATQLENLPNFLTATWRGCNRMIGTASSIINQRPDSDYPRDTNPIITQNCFAGCVRLSDYADIPVTWLGG